MFPVRFGVTEDMEHTFYSRIHWYESTKSSWIARRIVRRSTNSNKKSAFRRKICVYVCVSVVIVVFFICSHDWMEPKWQTEVTHVQNAEGARSLVEMLLEGLDPQWLGGDLHWECYPITQTIDHQLTFLFLVFYAFGFGPSVLCNTGFLCQR